MDCCKDILKVNLYSIFLIKSSFNTYISPGRHFIMLDNFEEPGKCLVISQNTLLDISFLYQVSSNLPYCIFCYNQYSFFTKCQCIKHLFFLDFHMNYWDETKILQYFGNLRHNLTTLNVFAEVVKVTNHIELSPPDTLLNASHWICFFG